MSVCLRGFWAFYGESMEGMAWNLVCSSMLYPDHLQKRFDFNHSLLIFLLWHNFDLRNGTHFGFPGILWRTHGRNGLKFGMLMDPDKLHTWLDFSLGLLIFLLLVQFWFSEASQILGLWSFYGEHMEGLAWHLQGFWNHCVLCHLPIETQKWLLSSN